jgi:hypothetical protein
MANGATYEIYQNSGDITLYIMTNAFGAVALVAMTPLVAIQVLGLFFKLHTVKWEKAREEFSALLEHEGEVVVLKGRKSLGQAMADAQIPVHRKRRRRRKKKKTNTEGGNVNGTT